VTILQLQNVKLSIQNLEGGMSMRSEIAQNHFRQNVDFSVFCVFSQNRAWLQNLSANNREILHLIDSAITIIVLEEVAPANEGEGMMYALNGKIENHWVDKSLAIYFFTNGTLASLCDVRLYKKI
jgi:nitrous oxidase accessory protein NosD